MDTLKGWIVPIIVLIILITVIWVGVYQINSDENPWDYGNDNYTSG